MAVDRFEDLIAWQKARALVRQVYVMSQDGGFARDFRFASQIQSAAVSSMSNIAEGFEWNSLRRFDQYLGIAKSSCAEVRSLLYAALDVGYLGRQEFTSTMELAAEVGRVIAGLRRSLKKKLPPKR